MCCSSPWMLLRLPISRNSSPKSARPALLRSGSSEVLLYYVLYCCPEIVVALLVLVVAVVVVVIVAVVVVAVVVVVVALLLFFLFLSLLLFLLLHCSWRLQMPSPRSNAGCPSTAQLQVPLLFLLRSCSAARHPS